MRYLLQVSIRWPDTDGDWQITDILPSEEAGPDWPVAKEDVGFTFDEDTLDRRVAQYIGDNGIPSMISVEINTHGRESGIFFIDKSECFRAGETSIPLPHARACAIDWRLCSVPEAGDELPAPVPASEHPGSLRISQNAHNGRWELRDPELNIVLATCKHEPMANAIASLYCLPFVLVNVHGGVVQDVTIPWGLAQTLKVLVVDWDQERNTDPQITITNEDGEELMVEVLEPTVRHPTGSADVDRAFAAYQETT